MRGDINRYATDVEEAELWIRSRIALLLFAPV